MAGLKLVLALAFSCFLAVIADDDHGTIAASYNTEVFNEKIPATPHFVMFFAPWCGHCKRLAPAWDQLAEHYSAGDKAIIAKVDCTVETALCKDQGVSGYPTLKFFNKDASEGERYKGGRDLEVFKTFIDDKVSPKAAVEEAPKKEAAAAAGGAPATEGNLVVLSGDTFEAHIATGSHFIKFYAPWCGHCKRLAPIWTELADAFAAKDDVSIAKVDCTLTENKDVCAKYEVRGFPTLLFFQNGEKTQKYSGGRDLTEMTKFVNKLTGGAASAPAPAPEKKVEKKEDAAAAGGEAGALALTGASFDSHIETGSHLIKFYAPWCGHCKRLAPVWDELAEAFTANAAVSISKIDCTTEDNRPVCSKFEVRGYPTLLFFKDGQKIEKYQGPRELSDLKKFVIKKTGSSEEEEAKKTSEDGKIPTEAAPAEVGPAAEPTIENGVVTYSAENFAKGVAEGTTFVKFFAPWCGHCKRLVPVWEDLAKKHEDNDQVKIAKLDCTTDREICTKYGVRGFPTLKLFHNGEVSADYNGGRDLNSLNTFVKSKTQETIEEKHDEL